MKGVVNITAHSFYPTRKTWVQILGDIPLVIFHCGSSQGRGRRVAGWYADALSEAGVTTSEAVVLEGGIKKFSSEHPELTEEAMEFPE